LWRPPVRLAPVAVVPALAAVVVGRLAHAPARPAGAAGAAHRGSPVTAPPGDAQVEHVAAA
jgi:hypothetical protein